MLFFLGVLNLVVFAIKNINISLTLNSYCGAINENNVVFL